MGALANGICNPNVAVHSSWVWMRHILHSKQPALRAHRCCSHWAHNWVQVAIIQWSILWPVSTLWRWWPNHLSPRQGLCWYLWSNHIVCCSSAELSILHMCLLNSHCKGAGMTHLMGQDGRCHIWAYILQWRWHTHGILPLISQSTTRHPQCQYYCHCT